jgi:prepilin-type N-terminal cleavage/methylation domain-containing protein
MRGRGAGFTIVELMSAVAILGILSAIAVPSLLRNARKAKSSEALVQLNKIYTASRVYILEIHATPGSASPTPGQFPEPEAVTPAASCCLSVGQKCAPNPADWSTPTWTALQFSMDDPHYFRYAYSSTGSLAPGPGSKFTAHAYGDLNCDGIVYSTFELSGVWSSLDLDVHGSGGFVMINETE